MDRIQKRFDDLEVMAGKVAESMANGTTQRVTGTDLYSNRNTYRTVKTYKIDAPLFLQWRRSVEALLIQVFDQNHPYYSSFTNDLRGNPHDTFMFLRATFDAAKEDYEGGYIFHIRSLVHAKVFADELEQANELLSQGYKSPAAVVAGVVLETTLKELCDQNKLALGSLNRMNVELAKAGVYNNARHDQVQAWSKIRNHAAHGQPDEFNETEVANMVVGICDFVANQLK